MQHDWCRRKHQGARKVLNCARYPFERLQISTARVGPWHDLDVVPRDWEREASKRMAHLLCPNLPRAKLAIAIGDPRNGCVEVCKNAFSHVGRIIQAQQVA